jgi:ABC-type sulfate/molybdate transport systems ATPase subunit
VPDLTLLDLHVERVGRTVLERCNVTFPEHCRTVLLGRSGVGKSTLLGAIAGLITPQRGRITLGADVLFSAPDGIDIAPHRRRVGYVFQDLALWPHLTAIQQVHLVGRTVGLDVATAFALLESVGLASLAQRRPGELSGGEQQRLAIARALAGKPAILLLDEPFSSVDRETRQSLYALIRSISPTVPGPTIYVTHDAEDAEALAEGAFRLEEGALTPAIGVRIPEDGGCSNEA